MVRQASPPLRPARWIQVSDLPSSFVFLRKAILGPFYPVKSVLFVLSVVLGYEYSALSHFLITPFVCLFSKILVP